MLTCKSRSASLSFPGDPVGEPPSTISGWTARCALKKARSSWFAEVVRFNSGDSLRNAGPTLRSRLMVWTGLASWVGATISGGGGGGTRVSRVFGDSRRTSGGGGGPVLLLALLGRAEGDTEPSESVTSKLALKRAKSSCEAELLRLRTGEPLRSLVLLRPDKSSYEGVFSRGGFTPAKSRVDTLSELELDPIDPGDCSGILEALETIS